VPDLRLAPAPSEAALPAGAAGAGASELTAMDDEALMQLSIAGHTRAFGVLVRRHEQRVRRFIGRMTGAAEADDLAQETFLSLWKARRRYRESGRLTVLLFRIARHKALSHLRWRRVRTVFALGVSEGRADDPLARSGPDDPLAAVLRRENDATTNALLQGIPLPLRETLALRYGEDLDYATIAAITGVAEASARSRAHRGLALLKQQLASRAEPAPREPT
jgi:RNA polymerase sigma factor (sigma-70 family)